MTMVMISKTSLKIIICALFVTIFCDCLVLFAFYNVSEVHYNYRLMCAPMN